MKIDELMVENFKCFKSEKFLFRELTILAGTNSSGKSSILSILSSIAQTQGADLFPFNIELNGDLIAMGSYKNIVNNGKVNNTLKISVGLSDKKDKIEIIAGYRYVANGNYILPRDVTVTINEQKLSMIWNGEQNGYAVRTEGSKIIGKTNEGKIKALMQATIAAISEDKALPSDDYYADFFQRLSKGSPEWLMLKEKKANDIVNKLKADPAFIEFIRMLVGIRNFFQKNFNYVGPIRSYPSREYRERHLTNKKDPTGEVAYQLINYWKKHSKEKYKKLINCLNMLELADGVDPRAVSGDLIEYKIKPHKHSESINIVDVGFGISQILPVLVSDIDMIKGSTLLVNQPEVHLHPSSQALLANYFAGNIENRNYIIETHSEYLINRLRLLVAKGDIDKDKVKIIYIDPESVKDDGSIVHDIFLEKSGALTGAPKRFFDTYCIDTFELAMNVE